MRTEKAITPALQIERISQIPGFTDPVASSDGPWEGITLELYNFDPGTGAPNVVLPEDYYLCVVHQGQGTAWTEYHHDQARMEQGQALVVPPGVHAGGVTLKSVQATSIYLKPAMVAHAVHESVNQSILEILPQLAITDKKIEYIALALVTEITSGFASGRIFSESMANALAVHMLANYATRPLGLREYRGGMPKYVLRRTIDYIDTNLGTNLGLAELARNAGMSPWYFCKTFKQSTSLSPHQYIMRERIERGKRLLAEGRLSIIEIAAELGFSDQSHFAAVFRRLTGMSPKRYVDSL